MMISVPCDSCNKRQVFVEKGRAYFGRICDDCISPTPGGWVVNEKEPEEKKPTLKPGERLKLAYDGIPPELNMTAALQCQINFIGIILDELVEHQKRCPGDRESMKL